MFLLEDETHAEPQGEFATFAEALAELRRRAMIPWDQAPNRAPCMSWKTCGRRYEIVEYDDSRTPWIERRRIPALEVSAAGIEWEPNLGAENSGGG
jgi:hypothetical protein